MTNSRYRLFCRFANDSKPAKSGAESLQFPDCILGFHEHSGFGKATNLPSGHLAAPGFHRLSPESVSIITNAVALALVLLLWNKGKGPVPFPFGL
jgi:hypothetical protein